jgi:NAD(P)-dependent dehydrogenase (short-subunit alcohol dehydrogenase family)
MNGLAGKVSFVTGGASGIGAAAVLTLAGAGVHVVFTDRNGPEGEAVAEAARKVGAPQGAKVSFLQGDVSNEAHIEKCVAAAVAVNGRLDFAFNNAGIEISGVPMTEATIDAYRRIHDANVLGVLLCMKHELRAMIKSAQKDKLGGSIVNTSSIAGSVGFAGAGIYVASKHAVIGLTKSAALEVAKHNIRVNSVSPGAIETPMIHRFVGPGDREALRQMAALHPLGRLGTSEEIARPVLFLFSDAASFITGTDLAIDGGFLTQ